MRASGEGETEFLWRIRKSAVPLMQRTPGRRQPLPFIEDITVNPTKVPECIAFLQKLFDRMGVEAVMVGHVGDGNLHTRPMFDPRDANDRLTMQRVYEEVSAYVLGVGGTLSGSMGTAWCTLNIWRPCTVLRSTKSSPTSRRAFDPEGVLNPGKKVAATGGDSAR